MADQDDQQPQIPNRPIESFLTPNPMPIWPAWVAPSDGSAARLVYVPHSSIRMFATNMGQNYEPLEGIPPVRIVFHDGTYLDLAAPINDMFERVLDLARIVATNEKSNHDRYLAQLLKQAAEQAQPAAQPVAPAPTEGNAAALLPVVQPQAQPPAAEEAWDDAPAPDDEPLEGSAQQLIDDVGPEPPARSDGVFPKEDKVRKRNRRHAAAK